MRIRKEDTVAIVIDVQERLFPHIHEHEQLALNMAKLVKGLKILQVPLLVTQQYTQGLGPTIPVIRDVLENFTPYEKLSFSCCGNSEFMRALSRLEKKYAILMGIEAHVCVLQTALDLLENKYLPVVIEDCVSSRRPNDKNMAIKRLLREGTLISTCESILFELCATAGTGTFKSISKLVK